VPLYEYECRKNGHRFELIRKFSDPPVKTCIKCKSKVERLISAPAIAFKGSGWYVTDYGKGNSGAKKDSDSKESKSSESSKAESSSKKESSSKTGSKSSADTGSKSDKK
jgi:putative FmdB family regulatory protein